MYSWLHACLSAMADCYVLESIRIKMTMIILIPIATLVVGHSRRTFVYTGRNRNFQGESDCGRHELITIHIERLHSVVSWEPFHNYLMSSWYNSWKQSSYTYLKTNDLIMSNFCTRCDSWALFTCVNSWPVWNSRLKITAKWIAPRIQSSAHISFVK